MSNTIDDRIETALKDTSFTDEHVRWLDGSLRDNMETCGGKAIHSLFLFGVFVVAWILLRSAAVGEISVMGVKIENAKIVALLLPVLAAYCLYAYHCFEAMAEIIHVARVRLYEVRYKNLYNQDIEQLLTYTTSITVDNAISNLQPTSSWLRRTSDGWLVASMLGVILLPLMTLAWMVYALLATPPLAWYWSLASALITTFFFVRTLMVLALHFKLID